MTSCAMISREIGATDFSIEGRISRGGRERVSAKAFERVIIIDGDLARSAIDRVYRPLLYLRKLLNRVIRPGDL